MNTRWGIGFLFCLLLTTGCAENPAYAPKPLALKNPFPAQEEVAKLGKVPAQNLAGRTVATPATWTVDAASVPSETTALETRFQALDENARGLTFRKDMRCFATELARLYSEQGAAPSERLQRFIEMACGAFVTRVQFAAAYGEDNVTLSDEKLLEQWHSRIVVPPNAGKMAGLAILRRGEKSFIMLAVADDATRVEITRAPEAGHFRLSGTLSTPSALALALINRGEYGVAKCDSDPNAILPAFSFSCALAKDDAWASVEIVSQLPGHSLLHSAAHLILRREDGGPVTFSTVKNPGDPKADVARAILERVNRMRVEANIGALAYAPKQSATHQRLAGHYFASELGNNPAAQDLISLGLVAGWDVEGGVIRNGIFFGTLHSGIADGGAWVDAAIDSPLGRFSLLDPTSNQIAIGTQKVDGKAGVAAIVTTYRFFDAVHHDDDVDTLFSRVNAIRKARSLAPIRRIATPPAIREEGAAVNAGKVDVQDALHDMLTSEVLRTGLSARGFVSLFTQIEAMDLPPELLAPAPFDLAIEVTHVRPERMPWGITVAYFIVERAEQTTAQRLPTQNARPKNVARADISNAMLAPAAQTK